MYNHHARYILATAKTIKTTPKGHVQISVEVKPHYRQEALRLLGKPGTTIKIMQQEQKGSENDMLDLDDNFGNY